MNDNTQSPAFLYGESVFTTCLIKNGLIQLWKEHLDQLLDNACSYFFLEKSDRLVLTELILDELKETNLEDGVLRITVSSKSRDSLSCEVTVNDLMVSSQKRKISKIVSSVKLKTVLREQSKILDHLKIGSYGKELYLKKLFQKEGFDDVLFVSENVFESSTSNIFFVKNNKLFTPASGIYKGITRARIIQLNKVEERQILTTEIESFDGAFLTNSVHGLIPIVSIDGHKFNLQDFSFVERDAH